MRASKLLLGLALAAALGAGGWFGWRWYTTPPPPDVPREGVSKELAPVLDEAHQAVLRQPRSGAAWGKLGMVLAANGYDPQAVRCFEQAERLDADDPRWPYLRGVRLLSGRPGEGVPLVRRSLALAHAPEQRATIEFRLAMALIADGELNEADEHLKALGALDPDGPRLQFGRGMLGAAREDWPAARQHLTPLADVPFARKQACAVLATLPGEDRERAAGYARRVLNLPADVPWPDAITGEMDQYGVNRRRQLQDATDLQEEGRLPEAVALMRRIAAESPGPEVYTVLGRTLFQMHELEEATEALRTAISFEPHNVMAHYTLGAALLMRAEKKSKEPGGKEAGQDLFRQALAAEDRALALKGDHGYAHLARGQALKGLGRTDEALAALRQAVLCQPEYADMHLALGEALAEAGQVREGLVHLEDAARLAKADDPRPRQALEKWRARSKATP
jgi:tetratricopeptide (TPR) repeat protein